MTWDDNLNPEHALIGIALRNSTALDYLELTGADFAEPRCEAVWDAIAALRGAGKPTDPITVHANLRADVRGIDAAWLAELAGAAPVPELAEHYAGLVAENATHRNLLAAATRIQQAVRENVPAQDAAEMARGWVDDVSRTKASTGFVADYLDDVIDSLEDEPEFTPTPWADLNHLIHGWMPGALYIVGARPGVGKSLFSTQAGAEIATHSYVAMNNLEMTHGELIKRLYSQIAKIKLDHLLFNKMEPSDWDLVAKHRGAVQSLKLSIDDRTNVRFSDIKSHARTVSRRGKLGAVIVDYIGLMSAAPGDRRERRDVIGEYSRQLKILAKELHVPVIALSQLNRDAAGRPPTLENLRESGNLEQDADVVILLHATAEDPSTLHGFVPKNRHGQTGDFELIRRGHYARLDNAQWEPH